MSDENFVTYLNIFLKTNKIKIFFKEKNSTINTVISNIISFFETYPLKIHLKNIDLNLKKFTRYQNRNKRYNYSNTNYFQQRNCYKRKN